MPILSTSFRNELDQWSLQTWNIILISPIIYRHIVEIRKETANIWEYKVGNNANIANFCVCEKPY